MNHDLFPSLDFRYLQNWAKRFVEDCFPGAGIDQITLREYYLWNKESPELAKALRLRSKSHPQYLVIIHLSEKYEHHNRREELIKAVHGTTIWDKQAYLDIGINTTFLNCLKRLTISKLCEEMQRFVFWCYGAKQGEYSPETNGFDWPLPADPKGESWPLYPEASSDGKPQSPFPNRFSTSSSYSGTHTRDGMEFISEIRDIDDDAFVSLEEIETLKVDTKKLMLRVNNNKLTAYRFIFMGVKIIDRTLKVVYDSTLPEDFKDLPLSEKTLFIRPFKNVQYESAVLRMGKLEPIIIDPDLDIVEYTSVVDGVEIIYRLYSRYEFENRTKLNFDIFPVPTVLSTLVATTHAATPTFPVPTKLEKLTVTSENEVYFKLSDIEALIPEPDHPDSRPPIPELHMPGVVKVEPQSKTIQDEKRPPAEVTAHEPCACNKIKEIDPKTCMLTYRGVQSQISGKGVFVIRQLLMNKGKELPVNFFIDGMNEASAEEVENNYEQEYESPNEPPFKILGKQSKINQTGVTDILDSIKDLKERLKEADISKKNNIEGELDGKQKLLREVKKGLQEKYKAWVDDNGVVHYRKNYMGETVVMKKEYKNLSDGIRKLTQSTIDRVKDPELKDHLIKSIRYGLKLKYIPSEPVEWETVK